MHEQIIERALQLGLNDQDLTFAEAIAQAAEEVADEAGEQESPLPAGAETFTNDGVLTLNRGVTARFTDGAEVQVTLVLSARPHN